MTTQPLRHAIIGVGAGILNAHKKGFALDTTEVVAGADVNPELGQQRADELGIPFYTDHRQMLSETNPDIAVIITPHPFHAQLAIDSFAAGCHVLVEKPIAIQVAEADDMIEAAQKADRLLAVNFQQRFRPEILTMHKILQEGHLGQRQYFDLTLAWPRSAAYYKSGGWRATWSGEGGGVLMNQSPHDLDLICHLMGLPHRVFAWAKTTIHQIEVEDTVQAMLEWDDGATGSFHTSTAEIGLSFNLEIHGTKGNLKLDAEGLKFRPLEVDVRDYLPNTEDRFPKMKPELQEIELESGTGDHRAIYENLHQAILQGTPVMADGLSSRMSLELANALIYSSYTGQPVDLPLDREKYANLLADLQAGRASLGN